MNIKLGRKHDQGISSIKHAPKGFFYNIEIIKDPRNILFMGKDGLFVQTDFDKAIYLSGNTGNKFNTRIATFETN